MSTQELVFLCVTCIVLFLAASAVVSARRGECCINCLTGLGDQIASVHSRCIARPRR
jgi:hypothetical protein